jgi:hypothetical protein
LGLLGGLLGVLWGPRGSLGAWGGPDPKEHLKSATNSWYAILGPREAFSQVSVGNSWALESVRKLIKFCEDSCAGSWESVGGLLGGPCRVVGYQYMSRCVPQMDRSFAYASQFTSSVVFGDVIDCGWRARCLDMPCASDSDRRAFYYVNFSQSVQRKPWGALGTVSRGDCS